MFWPFQGILMYLYLHLQLEKTLSTDNWLLWFHKSHQQHSSTPLSSWKDTMSNQQSNPRPMNTPLYCHLDRAVYIDCWLCPNLNHSNFELFEVLFGLHSCSSKQMSQKRSSCCCKLLCFYPCHHIVHSLHHHVLSQHPHPVLDAADSADVEREIRIAATAMERIAPIVALADRRRIVFYVVVSSVMLFPFYAQRNGVSYTFFVIS